MEVEAGEVVVPAVVEAVVVEQAMVLPEEVAMQEADETEEEEMHMSLSKRSPPIDGQHFLVLKH